MLLPWINFHDTAVPASASIDGDAYDLLLKFIQIIELLQFMDHIRPPLIHRICIGIV
jgi:hypothetical protein